MSNNTGLRGGFNIEALNDAKIRQTTVHIETLKRNGEKNINIREILETALQGVGLFILIGGILFLTVYNPLGGFSIVSYLAF